MLLPYTKALFKFIDSFFYKLVNYIRCLCYDFHLCLLVLKQLFKHGLAFICPLMGSLIIILIPVQKIKDKFHKQTCFFLVLFRIFLLNWPNLALPYVSAEKTSLNGGFMRQHIIIIMENEQFRNLMTLIRVKEGLSDLMLQMQAKYHTGLYKITELSVENVIEKYHTLRKKFYINKQAPKAEYWYENELRLFIWMFFVYLVVFQKEQKDLREEDWHYFSLIFNHKQPIFFQFQVRSFTKLQGRSPVWPEAEAVFLQEIISQQQNKNHWNFIARELFIKSQRRYFRTPKQCREKWMNHLDPSKIHTEWTPNEDFILVSTIKKKGKRWSLAVKELRNTRTEHMVKNRYKSLILNEKRRLIDKRQSDIQSILIKRLAKTCQRAPSVKEEIVYQSKNMKEQPRREKSAQLKRQSRRNNGRKEASERCGSDGGVQMQQQCVKREQQPSIFQITDHEQGLRLNSPIFTPLLVGSFCSNRMSLQSDEEHYPIYELQSLQNEDILQF